MASPDTPNKKSEARSPTGRKTKTKEEKLEGQGFIFMVQECERGEHTVYYKLGYTSESYKSAVSKLNTGNPRKLAIVMAAKGPYGQCIKAHEATTTALADFGKKGNDWYKIMSGHKAEEFKETVRAAWNQCSLEHIPHPQETPPKAKYIYMLKEECDGDNPTVSVYFKIGKEDHGRAGRLQTGNPRKLISVMKIRVNDCDKAERAAHAALGKYAVIDLGGGKEWFTVPISEIKLFEDTFVSALERFKIRSTAAMPAEGSSPTAEIPVEGSSPTAEIPVEGSSPTPTLQRQMNDSTSTREQHATLDDDEVESITDQLQEAHL